MNPGLYQVRLRFQEALDELRAKHVRTLEQGFLVSCGLGLGGVPVTSADQREAESCFMLLIRELADLPTTE